MAGSSPLVSVILVTYNHEQYIGRAIQSVLDQTYPDLEVVLVNDGSSDATKKIVSSFTDARLRALHQANQGPSIATNRALALCRGKYVAMMSGDDMFPPDRIEKQLRAYTQGTSRLLFSKVVFIDDDDQPLKTKHYEELYYKSNLTPAWGRAKVLRRLFDGHAVAFCLTLFTETAILKAEPVFCDPTLLQLQDYEWLIRLAKKYDFDYLEDKLYLYRIREGHMNLSGPDPQKLIRTRNEYYLMMRSFFDGISPELFKAMFPDLVRKPNFGTPIEYQCEQAFVFLKSEVAPIRLIGAERLYDLLRNKEAQEVLQREYNYSYGSFADTLALIDVEKMFADTQVYLDFGKGYSEEHKVCRPANRSERSFSFRFALPSCRPLQSVRWDPVENAYCQIWLDSAAWEDPQGRQIPIDVKQLTTNGAARPDGSILFGTKDPMVFLPVKSEVAALTLKGHWAFHGGEELECFRGTRLYLDDGYGLREDRSIERMVFLDDSDFELTFDTSAYKPVRMVRWDPVEECFCRIQLHAVTYSDRRGKEHSLDLTTVKSNGMQLRDGDYLFDTYDPMFSLPVQGDLASLTIRGRWWGPLSQTDVEYAKLLDAMAQPSRLASWIVKRGVRKLGRLRPRKPAA